MVLLLAFGSRLGLAQDAPPSFEVALKQAQARHAPVLFDFHAPWCYSCYYMAHKVLNGPEWLRVQHDTLVVDVDVDTPEGAATQKRLAVTGLPSYVAVDENGAELGRIVGEQTRADFYRQVSAMTSRTEALDALRNEVTGDGKYSLLSAHRLLHVYYERNDSEAAQAWLDSLPAAIRSAVSNDPKAQLWIARLQLLKAAQAQDPAQCAALAPKVFAGDLGCERAYELDRVMSCTASLPAPQRVALVASQKSEMAHLLTSRVFVGNPSCADARAEVLTTADLDDTLGYPKATGVLLDRAIEDAQHRLQTSDGPRGGLDLRTDRNLADNLRVFLDRAGKTEQLDQLYPKLIAAYPTDYVYPYRFAKSLVARGRDTEALPYLQQALPKAYGVNRLSVAQLEAQTLIKLSRADEARTVLADALKANGPWFPEKAAPLKAMLADSH